MRARANEAKLFSQMPVKKPLTSFKNRKLRLAFAKAHQNWTVDQWKNILFSDKSKYNLFGSASIGESGDQITLDTTNCKTMVQGQEYHRNGVACTRP